MVPVGAVPSLAPLENRAPVLLTVVSLRSRGSCVSVYVCVHVYVCAHGVYVCVCVCMGEVQCLTDQGGSFSPRLLFLPLLLQALSRVPEQSWRKSAGSCLSASTVLPAPQPRRGDLKLFERSVTPKGITRFFMASLCGIERNEQVWLADGLRSWKENAERGP